MLIEFRFKNYRSFRDEAVLSMEATGLGTFRNSLIHFTNDTKLLPGVAIYGKTVEVRATLSVRSGWRCSSSGMPSVPSMKRRRSR